MPALVGRRIGILTVSDSVASGRQADTSGDVAVEMLSAQQVVIAARDVVHDDRLTIGARLRAYADDLQVDLVLTNGGSGVAPRDVTPEATLDVVERLVPGLPEAARARTLAATPLAALSRAVAGIRGRTLIINLPGSPQGVRQWLEVLLPLLPHALDLLAEQPPSWGTPHTP